MKKFYYSIITICILFTNTYAQSPNYTWAKQFGGTNGESGRSVAVDNNGNVYSTGVFAGTCDFDPSAAPFNLIATGGQDVYVSKLDSMGNFKWAKKIGGVITDNSASIKVDNSGNTYVAGTFNGTCSFGIINLTSAGMGDIFVCKLDTGGNFLWAKRFGGTGNDAGLSVCVDGAGNVFSTGYFSNTSDFNPDPSFTFNLVSAGSLDIFISKLDASGTFVAAYQLGGTSLDQGFDISLDAAGNIYTTGNFSGSADFDPSGASSLLNAGTGEDIYINKLSSTGNFVWAKNMSGTSFTNSGFSLAIDVLGNVYSTGYFNGTIDFDPGGGVSTLNSNGSSDSYISKLDTLGNFVWVKQIGGPGSDGSYSLSLDGNSNVYTGGDFQNMVDFDPGGGTFNMTSSTFDAYTSKLDASGNFIWAIQIATNNGGPSITVDASSHLYITGAFSGTTDFDAGAGMSNLTVVGSFDAYVTKYVDCLTTAQPGAISGADTICSGTNNTYSITPVSGATSYTWTLPGGWTGTSTTNSINTTASSTSGNMSVTANNSCGSSAAQILAITVNSIPATPGTISGTTTICSGSNNMYSITAIAGATSYTWTLPSGWSGSSTTNSINTTAGVTSGNITVTANNGCGSSPAQMLSITVNIPPATPGIISGSTTICEGSANTYSITAVPGATSYTWTLPGGWSGTSTTNSINTTASSTGGNISVTANNTCGSSPAQTRPITVHPLPIVNFNYPGSDTVCTTYGIQLLSGGTPSGGTYSGTGVTGTNFDPNAAGLGNHVITYTYTDGNTCTNMNTTTITVIGCAGIEDNNEESVLAYPNPFTNSITVNGIQESIPIKLYNSLGEAVGNWILSGANTTISTDELQPGIYFLHVGTCSIQLIKF
jgi:hypothetical protein